MSNEQHHPSAKERTSFLVRNLFRGFLWLTAIVVLYILARKYLDFDLKEWLGPLYDNVTLIYVIFLLSEVIFGIIPPEIFMFWAARHESLDIYINNVIALTFMSYFAGIIGYFIGSYFNTTQLYRTLKKNVFGKFEVHFNNYGGFLVVVAALTPIPFSGICMLVGAVKYDFRKFMWFSLFRFVRFIAYSIVIWEANYLS